MSDLKKEERAKAFSLLTQHDDLVESDWLSGSGSSTTATGDSSSSSISNSNSYSDRNSGRDSNSNRDRDSSNTDYRSPSMTLDEEIKGRNYIDTPVTPSLSDHEMSAIFDKYNPTRFVTRTVLRGQENILCSSPYIVCLFVMYRLFLQSPPFLPLTLPPSFSPFLPLSLPPSFSPFLPPFLPLSLFLPLTLSTHIFTKTHTHSQR